MAQFVPPPSPPNPDFPQSTFPVCETTCEFVWGVYVSDKYILPSGQNAGLYVLRMR